MDTMLCKDTASREDASAAGEPKALGDRLANASLPDIQASSPSSRSVSQTFLMPALELHRAGRFDEAEELYERILLAEPDHASCLHYLGLIAYQKGDLQTAVAQLEHALRIKPDDTEALSNLAALYRAQGLASKAIEMAQRALAHDPHYAQAYCNQGGALEDLLELEAALACYQKAIDVNPGFIQAAINAANLLRRLRRPAEAIQACEALIAQRPDAAEPYLMLGTLLREQARSEAALMAFRQALALRPRCAEAYNNIGNLLNFQGQYQEAQNAFAEAIAIKPDFAQAYAGLGVALESLSQPLEAIEAFRTALKHDPKLLNLRLWLHHRRRAICDWDGIMEEETELLRLFTAKTQIGNPFPLISMNTTPADQYRLCRAYGLAFENKRDAYRHVPRPSGGGKLRIGYLSNDFYRHATALLMVELFERHDRTQFEIIAYSYGPDDHSELGLRTREAFDRFTDIHGLSDTEAAELIDRDGIDILIDLKGYTNNARTGILGLRPAPIQVNFLGFPGTMGVDFIDYIIADPFILPMDQQSFFSEKIVHLPHSYQPNDSRRQISDLTPARKDCGLPEEGFVFCCFNNSYKITPALFTCWMRLLQAVPGSVLWLLESHPVVKDNLSREAEKCGIAPNRLVFAPKIAVADHLARHRLADLFLDCLPYNAHTTASDALWAGLPVLTYAGHTFASRVAGSLLHAVGLPELITTSLSEYEALALHLARNPNALQDLRRKLLSQRHHAPLFDIELYRSHLEAAYRHMWHLFEEGEAPQAFAIEPLHLATEGLAARAPAIARIPLDICPLCQGTHHELLLSANMTKDPLYRSLLPAESEWRRCQDCGHIFAAGFFSETVQRTHFARTLPEEVVGHDMEKLRPLSAIIVERVAHYLPKTHGAWLDAGFGNGSLLFTAEEWGFTPVGLEQRKKHVETLSGLGYEAYQGSLLDYDWPERFSVISLSRVLERVTDPHLALRAARRFLRPDGVLFLSLRNRGNMIWRLLQANQNNPYWGDLRAIHLFDRERLESLLIEEHFRPAAFMVDERLPLGMGIIALRDDSPLLN